MIIFDRPRFTLDMFEVLCLGWNSNFCLGDGCSGFQFFEMFAGEGKVSQRMQLNMQLT